MDTMGFDVVGEDEVVGDDVLGDDVVGYRAAQLRHALARRGAARPALRMPPALSGASSQGVSQPKEEMDSLPFTIETPIPAGVLSAGFASALVALPQRPFRGERLILAAFKTNAGVMTDVSSLVAISPAIYVGAVQVGASQGEQPFAAFGAQAFGVRLAMPPSGQGTRIYIPFILKFAQVAGDSTIVTATLIGRAVR